MRFRYWVILTLAALAWLKLNMPSSIWDLVP